MKAQFVNEIKNFERNGDPKNQMNIGLTNQRILDNAIRDLSNIGIESKAVLDQGGGYYLDMKDPEDSDVHWLQLMYMDDETAINEYDEKEGGWILYNENGDVLEENTKEFNKILLRILSFKYGNVTETPQQTLIKINNEIFSLNKKIDKLEREKQIFQKYIKK